MSHIKVDYEPRYHGHVQNGRAQLVLGPEENEFGPYDLVLGGLSGCFYVTFLGITEKMQLTFTGVSMSIEGHHREEAPTLLQHIIIDMEVQGADREKEKQFQRAVEIAGKYCSVYQTLSAVAEIEVNLTLTA